MTHRPGSATAVLVINGSFDTLLVPQVQPQFDSLLTDGVRFVILDLGGVDFIDSSALALLVSGMRRCRERNGELLLCRPSEPLREIFTLTHLDQAFRIYADGAAAQSALAQE